MNKEKLKKKMLFGIFPITKKFYIFLGETSTMCVVQLINSIIILV